MVWIHGGSYVFGAGDAAIYDPRALVEEQGVIVVSVTYRLGLFGFLGGSDGRAANVGLLDIIEALRWSKRNIRACGGAPDCITLFGQSAGGDAIAHLMIAAQSCVVSAAEGFGWPASMPFGTQYGHHPLPTEEELDAAWSRCARNFDVLVGNTAEEGSFFIPLIESLRKVTRIPLLGAFLRRFVVRTITHKVYAAAVARFAQRHAGGGGRAYTYRLDWGSRTNGFGATHAIDLPLLFSDEPAWSGAELLHGLEWAHVHASGQAMRELCALRETGSLPDRGRIEPNVLGYNRVEPRGVRGVRLLPGNLS